MNAAATEFSVKFADINVLVQAIEDTVKEEVKKVVDLDMKWDMDKNADGQVVKSYNMALIQIGCCDLEGKTWAALFQLAHLRVLATN